MYKQHYGSGEYMNKTIFEDLETYGFSGGKVVFTDPILSDT
jgi:hypothetical protein